MGRRVGSLAPAILKQTFRLEAFRRLWGGVVAFGRVVALLGLVAFDGPSVLLANVPSAEDSSASISSSGSASVSSSAFSSDESFLESQDSTVAALNLRLPKEFHAWGAHEVGAWNFSRTVVENRRKNSSSNQTVMETFAALREKQENRYSVVAESVVLLAGKTIPNEPKNSSSNFWGLSPDEKYSVTELPSQLLEIDGVPLKCRVVQFESASGNAKRRTTFWINESTAPYLLRRERTVFDPSGKKVVQTMTQRVTSLNFPFFTCGRILNVFKYSVVETDSVSVSNSEAIASFSVPGRVVAQITHEKDLNGNPLQDISTELLDYGTSRLEYQSGLYRSSVRAKRLVLIPPDPSIWNLKGDSDADATQVAESEAGDESRRTDLADASDAKIPPSGETSSSLNDERATGRPLPSPGGDAEKKQTASAGASGPEGKKQNETAPSVPDFQKESLICQKRFLVSDVQPDVRPDVQSESDVLVDNLELTDRDYRGPLSDGEPTDLENDSTDFAFMPEKSKNKKNRTISLKISVDANRNPLTRETVGGSAGFARRRWGNATVSTDAQRLDAEPAVAFRTEDLQREVQDRRREKDFLKGILLSDLDFQSALEEIEAYSQKERSSRKRSSEKRSSGEQSFGEESSEEFDEPVERVSLPGDRLCFWQFHSYWQTGKTGQGRAGAGNSALDILRVRFSYSTASYDWDEETGNGELRPRVRSFSPLYDSTLRFHARGRDRRSRATSVKNSRITHTKSIREDMGLEENRPDGEESLKKGPAQEGFLRKGIQFLIQKSNEIP